jgi:hypothetical protein
MVVDKLLKNRAARLFALTLHIDIETTQEDLSDRLFCYKYDFAQGSRVKQRRWAATARRSSHGQRHGHGARKLSDVLQLQIEQ